MLKLRTNETLLFGLSAMNIEKLIEGRPIVIDLKQLGMESGSIVIFYGVTEEAMMDELKLAGLVPEQ